MTHHVRKSELYVVIKGEERSPCSHRVFAVREVLQCLDQNCLAYYPRRATDAKVGLSKPWTNQLRERLHGVCHQWRHLPVTDEGERLLDGLAVAAIVAVIVALVLIFS